MNAAEMDALQVRALALCAAHQDGSPTRQPCAACSQDASTESDDALIAAVERLLAAIDRAARLAGRAAEHPEAMSIRAEAEKVRAILAGPSTTPAWCLCGVVDDRGNGTCGSCGLRIMTDDDEPSAPPGVSS